MDDRIQNVSEVILADDCLGDLQQDCRDIGFFLSGFDHTDVL